jgi:orotidine-5'-phosphate decarboxylase
MFADKITERISATKSVVVAGFDPRPEAFPEFFMASAHKSGVDFESRTHALLREFHLIALEAIAHKVAAIKPNAAFFEQFGLGGMRALKDICDAAESIGMPVIMDAKRGDIGSTAEAYSKAFLGESTLFGETIRAFPSDALTVNPFLGFDTLEPFIKECQMHGRGIFVLVKTSNPGSADLQGSASANGNSKKIAEWLSNNGEKLLGKSGYSGLGAVVGATYPEEARQLREIMPNNLFLVPGYGAQGGTAKDILPNFDARGGGALINVSRGLLGSFSKSVTTPESFKQEILGRIDSINQDLNTAIKEVAK